GLGAKPRKRKNAGRQRKPLGARRRNERGAKPRREKGAGAQRKQLGPSSSREKRKRSYANKSGCVRKLKRVVEKSSWPRNAQGPRRRNGLGARPRRRTSAGAQKKPLGPRSGAATRKRSNASESGVKRRRRLAGPRNSWPRSAQRLRRKSVLGAKPRRQKNAGAQKRPLARRSIAA